MVKTFKQQKTNISAFTTSATATATAGILFSAFDDNPKPAYFALVTHGIDRHRLRIFNIRSGAVNNDYSSENKEKFTSLTWGNIADDKEHATVSITTRMYNAGFFFASLVLSKSRIHRKTANDGLEGRCRLLLSVPTLDLSSSTLWLMDLL